MKATAIERLAKNCWPPEINLRDQRKQVVAWCLAPSRDPADGSVKHFYSCSAEDTNLTRGIDLLTPFWNILDLTPAGRGDWRPKLEYTLSNVRSDRGAETRRASYARGSERGCFAVCAKDQRLSAPLADQRAGFPECRRRDCVGQSPLAGFDRAAPVKIGVTLRLGGSDRADPRRVLPRGSVPSHSQLRLLSAGRIVRRSSP